MYRTWLLLIYLVIHAGNTCANAQDGIIAQGDPPITYYGLDAYIGEERHIQGQHWAIAQLPNGVMYFGSQGGLLEYDGSRWKTYTDAGPVIRSLAISDQQRLYLAGNNTLGYMAPDSLGAAKYFDLTPLLDSQHRNFESVYHTVVTSSGVLFKSSRFLFCYRGDSIAVLSEGQRLHSSFYVNDRFYVRVPEQGLMQLQGDSLSLVADGKIFARDLLYAMLPYRPGQLLLASRDSGLYLYDDEGISRFDSPANEWLRNAGLYGGLRLRDNTFVLNTVQKGICQLDASGRMIRILDEAAGLGDNNVKRLYQSAEGQLWAALNNGISKIDIESPVSIYDKKSGLDGSVQCAGVQGRYLYVGTSQGIYFLAQNNIPHERPKFRKMPLQSGQCRTMLAVRNGVVAACRNGLYLLRDGQNTQELMRGRLTALWPSVRSDVFYSAVVNQVKKWSWRNGGWHQEAALLQVDGTVYSGVEDEQGQLWMGTQTSGLLHIDSSGNAHQFRAASGIDNGPTYVYRHEGKTIISTEGGNKVFNRSTGRFHLAEIYDQKLQKLEHPIFRAHPDVDGTLYFDAGSRNYIGVRKADGLFTIDSTIYGEFPTDQVNDIFLDSSGNAWFSATNALQALQIDKIRGRTMPAAVLIREISFGNDSTIYHGFWNSANHLLDSLQLPDDFERIRFKFSLPHFRFENGTEYQVRLSGYDSDWLPRRQENLQEYTGLWEGEYAFEVRAITNAGKISMVDRIDIRILPPFWRTGWAYLFYAVLVIAAVYGYTKRQVRIAAEEVRKKEREKARKEREIAQKEYLTKEIAMAAQLQKKLLPERFPQPSGFQIDGLCLPAFEVGGDHYDYVWLDEKNGLLCIILVDVEGKQMSGAFPSVLVNGICKSAIELQKQLKPAQLVSHLNHVLRQSLDEAPCVAQIIVQLDGCNGRVRFVNAGCPSPIICQGGNARIIQTKNMDFGPMLGIAGLPVDPQSGASLLHDEFEVSLGAGDLFLLYSDGLLEPLGENARNQLVHLVEGLDLSKGVEEAGKDLMQKINASQAGRRQIDDQTYVLIYRCP